MLSHTFDLFVDLSVDFGLIIILSAIVLIVDDCLNWNLSLNGS